MNVLMGLATVVLPSLVLGVSIVSCWLGGVYYEHVGNVYIHQSTGETFDEGEFIARNLAFSLCLGFALPMLLYGLVMAILLRLRSDAQG